MKYLVDQPHEHGYIYLKTVTEIIRNPSMRTINKEIYACGDCGLAMEVYDLENYTEVGRE